MLTPATLLFALLGGILPALLWLFFWLREDRLHPEPRRFIIYVFIAGMLTVPLALPLEQFAATFSSGELMFIIWAATEEVLKFSAAYLIMLRRREVDEPIDAVLYMITVALGFAALENVLFLMRPLEDGNVLVSIMTGNLRFFGATLLHTLASAVIGLAIALPFYRNPRLRRLTLICGLVLAIVLHTLFNFFILMNSGGKILIVFAGVWVGIIILLLLFEKVKRVKRPQFIYLRNKK
ncbi:MAG TPA: PrsW family intramembrane metalloprotease [Candidatus Paceibacterota bacterium]